MQITSEVNPLSMLAGSRAANMKRALRPFAISRKLHRHVDRYRTAFSSFRRFSSLTLTRSPNCNMMFCTS